MNKGEFIEFVANENSVSKAEAERSIDTFINGVINAIASGRDVSLLGFGNFSNNAVAARVGINPKTKEPLKIEARNQVRFKVGSKLKDAANSKDTNLSSNKKQSGKNKTNKNGKDKVDQKNATGEKDTKSKK